jgi:mRNA interferase MazF
MGLPARGDLVVVNFPFSDLSGAKCRPALVVGHAEKGDVILCQLTSQSYHDKAIEIDPAADVSGGLLRSTSYARALKLFTAHQRLIRGTIGKLSDDKLELIVAQIVVAVENRVV